MGHLPAPVFPPGANPGNCAPRYRTQADLLGVFDRILPDGYLAPLKSPGPGYELLRAYAKMVERVSLAVGRLECGGHAFTSHGGVYSTGLVQFYRDSASLGAFTQKAGTVVSTGIGDRRFIVLDDAVFGPADLVSTPADVRIIAMAAGWEWNVPGQVTYADGTIRPGEIDRIERPLQDPPFGDPTVRVRQIVATAGGQAAMLDQLGEDRGISRRPGELDGPYRARVRSLPDTVSPAAMQRATASLLEPLGLTADFIETFEIRYQTCWDGPDSAIPLSGYDPSLFVYDDPRSPVPFRNRWLSEEDYRGAFIVVVPNLAALRDVGMAFDDTAMNPAAHATLQGTTAGRRATNAYDIKKPEAAQEPLILRGGYDGFDLEKAAVYKGLADTYERIKAGGVTVAVELSGQ